MAKVTVAYSDTLAWSKRCHYRRAHLYELRHVSKLQIWLRTGLGQSLKCLLNCPPELFLGEGVVARGGEAETQLLLRQAVLVPDVELLEGLPQRVLQCYGTLGKNLTMGRSFMTSALM